MSRHRALRRGELFDYLVESGRIDECGARVLFGQLCSTIYYVRDQDAVHCDLNLGHVLLDVLLDERCRVKLGDFGFTRGLKSVPPPYLLRDYWIRQS